jgi:hypothetical protein
MGLDLYHFKANAERRGKPWVIEPEKGWEALLAKLSWCIVTMHREDEHFAKFARRDLFATLSDYGIETDYTQISPLPAGGRLFKTHSDDGGWLPALIVLDDTGRIGLPTLYVEEIGYQRNRVAGAFYDEFPAAEYVCAPERVRRIHELTDADDRSDFKEQFLDAWGERESFVFFSW